MSGWLTRLVARYCSSQWDGRLNSDKMLLALSHNGVLSQSWSVGPSAAVPAPSLGNGGTKFDDLDQEKVPLGALPFSPPTEKRKCLE
jgi:hypothetical protein